MATLKDVRKAAAKFGAIVTNTTREGRGNPANPTTPIPHNKRFTDVPMGSNIRATSSRTETRRVYAVHQFRLSGSRRMEPIHCSVRQATAIQQQE